jgi:drug/metabolite transporter superfamily protein YnfA
VTGEWRWLNKKELYALYFSLNIFRLMKSKTEVVRVGRVCSTYGGV